jgi:hypothetical protein
MNHVKDKMLELNPKIVFEGSIPKIEPWSASLEWRCHKDGASYLN